MTVVSCWSLYLKVEASLSSSQVSKILGPDLQITQPYADAYDIVVINWHPKNRILPVPVTCLCFQFDILDRTGQLNIRSHMSSPVRWVILPTVKQSEQVSNHLTLSLVQ